MKLFRKLFGVLAAGLSAVILMHGAAADITPPPLDTPAPTSNSSTQQIEYEEALTFLDDTEPMQNFYKEIDARTDAYDESTDIGKFFAEAQYKFHDAFGTALTEEIGKTTMIIILIAVILLSMVWASTGHKSYPIFASLLLFLLMNGLSIAELICAATGGETAVFKAVPVWLNAVVFLLSAVVVFFCFKRRRFSAFITMTVCTLPLTMLGGWLILREQIVNAYAVWLGYRPSLPNIADSESAGTTLTVLAIIFFSFSIGLSVILSLLGAKFKKPFLMVATSLTFGSLAGYLLAALITKTSKLSLMSYLAMGLLVLGGFLLQLYIGHGFLEQKAQKKAASVRAEEFPPQEAYAPDFGPQNGFAPAPGADAYPAPAAPSFPGNHAAEPFAPSVQQPAYPSYPEQSAAPEEPAAVPFAEAPAEPKAAFCTVCGEPMDPDAVFCTSCGAKKGSNAPQPAPSQPEAPQSESPAAEPETENASEPSAFTDPFTGLPEQPAPESPLPKIPDEPKDVSNQFSRSMREKARQAEQDSAGAGGPVIRMGTGEPKPEDETGLVLHFEKKQKKTSTGEDVFDQDDGF